MHDERYSQQSLQSIKKEIAAIAKENEAQAPQLIRNHYSDSHQEVGLYTHLSTLFAAIDRGNPDLNVPTYNGGLFMTVFEQEKLPDLWTAEERVARFLDEHKIPDRYLGTGA